MKKIILYSQLAEIEHYVDQTVFRRLGFRQLERFEQFDNECLISFDCYNIFNHTSLPLELIIYFSGEHLFFICEDESLLDKVTSMVKNFPENDKVLYYFFSDLLKPDMDYLETIEDEVLDLEDNLLINSKTKCARDIIMFRKKLIRLKKYYEQLDIIFDDIKQNENNIISHAHIKYFVILGKRVDRLLNTVFHLRDFVTQVREAYQAQIDIEQNGIMKIFTVITSIFLPLTLIVGWYGMNLQMPEYSWNYGYVGVIVLSIAVCVICVAVFKIKKWF